jgi:hypothetical protein
VRTDKNRQPLHDKTLKGGPTGTIGVLPPISFGRLKIEEEIKTAATQIRTAASARSRPNWERFFEWKRVEREDEPCRVSLEVMIRGTCEKTRPLDHRGFLLCRAQAGCRD